MTDNIHTKNCNPVLKLAVKVGLCVLLIVPVVACSGSDPSAENGNLDASGDDSKNNDKVVAMKQASPSAPPH